MPQLPDEIISEIFKQCFFENDLTGVYASACTNKYFHDQIITLAGPVNQLDLNKFCPGLRILDAQTVGLRHVFDEPPIKKLATIQCFQDMAPHVENNAGLTLLTMPRGLTLNRLLRLAASREIGTRVAVHWDISKELGDVPVEHTYRVMITNNVFINSRNRSRDAQEKLVRRIGCEMPTVQEYVYLCIATKVIFNIYLYEKNSWTLGRSSTQVNGVDVFVGASPCRASWSAANALLTRAGGQGDGGSRPTETSSNPHAYRL